MDTVNGNRDLSSTYGCITTILNINGGGRTDVTLTRYKKDYLRFWICPHIYTLCKEWKIIQPNNQFILVSDLMTKTDKTIFNKFNQQVDYQIISDGHDWMGIPDIEVWYDKKLVISRV